MIVWAVALDAEARPLVEARGLRPYGGPEPWRLYARPELDEVLVVTGVGRAAAAAACGWVKGRLSLPAHAAWLNAGIAGHSSAPVGRALLAHRVFERATDRAWYPPPLPGHSLASDTLYTVDRVESEFSNPGAYDMEGSGFLTATARLATAEAVQLVKVVSDSPAAPASSLDRRSVSLLLGSCLGELDDLARALAAVSTLLEARAKSPPGLEELVAGGRFSVTQRRQLRRLLERHEALGLDPAALERFVGRPAKEALRDLAGRVERRGLGA